VNAVADQVSELRSLRYQRPVTPEPITHDRLVQLLRSSLDQEYPAEMEARRGRAWATIGAIPAGTDLRKAIDDFAGSQIIGFYDTVTHRLVFVGSSHPTPFQRMTLAHELTHALDDQDFDLGRIDRLLNACQDERSLAFLGLAEGDAVQTQLRWARTDLSATELVSLQREAASFTPPPSTVPPFLRQMLEFPYIDGRAFVDALTLRGGQSAVNAAFRNPPLSTEQIIHPGKYPGDRPVPVTVPDLREKLGGPWTDLDVGDVGEAWLRTLLGLRLPVDQAAAAAAGWGGGAYKAWSLEGRTAVLMRTEWDDAGQAREFVGAMGGWIGDQAAAVQRTGTRVDVLFGSDPLALHDLERSVG
jgi:hypothetical protein